MYKKNSLGNLLKAGVYILENTTPPPGEYQPMSFGGKQEKGNEKKEERGIMTRRIKLMGKINAQGTKIKAKRVHEE